MKGAKKKSNEFMGIFFACITAFLWGFLAIGLKVAVDEIPTETIIFSRFLTAFVILFVYYLIKAPKTLKIIVKPPWILLFAAVCLGLNYLGFNKGIEYTSPSNAQVFIQSGAIILAISGIFIFKEKVSAMQVIGFAIAIVGFVFFYSNQVDFSGLQNYNKGILFLLMGGITWAIYAILQKILVHKHSTGELNLVIYLIPIGMFVAFTDFSVFQNLSPGYWILLIALGINTLIAYGCLNLALKYLDANKVSIIITLNPIITFVAMYIFKISGAKFISMENLGINSVIGASLVISGAITALYFGNKNAQKKVVN